MSAHTSGMKSAALSLLLGIVLLALPGCGHAFGVATVLSAEVPEATAPLSAEVTFHADTDFTTQERQLIQSACDVWRKQTGGQAIIRVKYDLDFNDLFNLQNHKTANDNLLVRATSELDMVTAADDGYPGSVLGWMTSGGIHNPEHQAVNGVFVVDRMDGVFLSVVVHEFGHALGLPHNATTQSVMYPSVNPARTACLKRTDIASFCNINGCDGRTTYPCE